MNFSNGNPEEDMSMEDILSSIRKYVTEESEKKEAIDYIKSQLLVVNKHPFFSYFAITNTTPLSQNEF